MSLAQRLLNLTRQLYPTGKAFKMPFNGFMESLHIALALSEARFYRDALATLFAILPDNDNFTADDAADWERRLGMITNPDVDLEDRKLAIKRKMNHPGTIKARQHRLYLQTQLQAAGFNVWVHENIPEINPINFLINQNYAQLGNKQLGDFQLGSFFSTHSDLIHFVQLGDFQLGQAQLNTYFWKNKVVNHINWRQDLFFAIGSNFRSVFFIGGETRGTFANVNVEREPEFRQLILKIKPAQTVALLFINYDY